jgi:prepilin-type N-terminal cleavage/methylation domain-containing protein
MSNQMTKQIDRKGFTLVELLLTVTIGLIAALAVIPQMQQRIRQSEVDAYTSRLEAGIKTMKASMINRQDTCTIVFPIGSGSETEITPLALENLQIDTTGNTSDCPRPTDMSTASGTSLKMNNTDTRLVNIKGSLSSNQLADIRLLISAPSISMTTIGGVTAPDPSVTNDSLNIRIRSRSLRTQNKGFERCLSLEPMTGTLIRGTWVGGNFGQGTCNRNQ